MDGIPTLSVGFNDLAVLRSIICSSLMVLRRVASHTQQRQTQMRLLEGVYQRLAGIPSQAKEAQILLSAPEIDAVNSAIVRFAVFVRQKVSPSTERDETLQDLERLRQCLMAML